MKMETKSITDNMLFDGVISPSIDLVEEVVTRGCSWCVVYWLTGHYKKKQTSNYLNALLEHSFVLSTLKSSFK
jgi:hypothetical protein